MRTPIITLSTLKNLSGQNSICYKTALAIVLLFFIAVKSSSAQQTVTTTAVMTSVYVGSHFQKQLSYNQFLHLSENSGTGVNNTHVFNDAVTGHYLKQPYTGAKHIGLNFLSDVIGFTKLALTIPGHNKNLSVALSLKTDRIAIEPKGPGNFHYAAISFKVKF